MSPRRFPVRLPLALPTREAAAAAEPLLAFAESRLAELEAQRDALALFLLFEDNPIIHSLEFSRRDTPEGRHVQLGAESAAGDALFLPSECRSPYSEVSSNEACAEEDARDWIDSLSERSLARLSTGCFLRDDKDERPLEERLIEQALGPMGYEAWLGDAALSGPDPAPEAGPVETLWTPARLALADPQTPHLLHPDHAAQIQDLGERLDALLTQRAVFELADWFERWPEAANALLVPKPAPWPSRAPAKAFEPEQAELASWSKTLPESRRLAIAGRIFARPDDEGLVPGLMRALLPPAAFAQWQAGVLRSEAGAPANPASPPRLGARL